jgi:hypothetical protein
MVKLMVYLSIEKCPSKFTNVTVWENCTLDSQIFLFREVYYSNSVIFNNYVKLLFQIVGLKMSSLPT